MEGVISPFQRQNRLRELQSLIQGHYPVRSRTGTAVLTLWVTPEAWPNNCILSLYGALATESGSSSPEGKNCSCHWIWSAFPPKYSTRSPGLLQVPLGCAWLGMWGGGGSAFETGAVRAGLTGQRWTKRKEKCPQGPRSAWTSGQARGPTGLHLVRFPTAGSGYLSRRAEGSPQELPSSAGFPLWPQTQSWPALCLCACAEPPPLLREQPLFSRAGGHLSARPSFPRSLLCPWSQPFPLSLFSSVTFWLLASRSNKVCRLPVTGIFKLLVNLLFNKTIHVKVKWYWQWTLQCRLSPVSLSYFFFSPPSFLILCFFALSLLTNFRHPISLLFS